MTDPGCSGVWVNGENSGRQSSRGHMEGLAGEMETGSMLHDGADAGTFYMPVLYHLLAVAHLFRVPGVREAVGGSPLEGLEQFSRGSLPQRGSREGSGMGGDRPWKLRARGLRATPGGLR